jgi:hypothetical protein
MIDEKLLERIIEIFNSVELKGLYKYSKSVKVDKENNSLVLSYRDEFGDHEIVYPIDRSSNEV